MLMMLVSGGGWLLTLFALCGPCEGVTAPHSTRNEPCKPLNGLRGVFEAHSREFAPLCLWVGAGIRKEENIACLPGSLPRALPCRQVGVVFLCGGVGGCGYLSCSAYGFSLWPGGFSAVWRVWLLSALGRLWFSYPLLQLDFKP